jgi:hypothetical protein
MDEKGFSIGLIGRRKRIFSRRQWEKKDDHTGRRDDRNPKRLGSREIRTRAVLGNGAAVVVFLFADERPPVVGTGSTIRRLPFLSVTRMRLSGRKANAHGPSKSVIGVVLNGCWRVFRGCDDMAKAPVINARAQVTESPRCIIIEADIAFRYPECE